MVGREKKMFKARETQKTTLGKWRITVHGWSVRLGSLMLCFLRRMGIGDGRRGRGRQRMVALYNTNFILSEIQALK